MGIFDKLFSNKTNLLENDNLSGNNFKSQVFDGQQIVSGMFYNDKGSHLLKFLSDYCDNHMNEELSVIYFACYLPTRDIKIGNCTDIAWLKQRICNLGFVQHEDILKSGVYFGFIFIPKIKTGKKIPKGRYPRDQYLSDAIEYGFHHSKEGMYASHIFGLLNWSPFGIATGKTEWYRMISEKDDYFSAVQEKMLALNKFVGKKIEQYNNENSIDLKIINRISL